MPSLKEPRPGVFYRRGQAFLHFHEDPSGDFADLRGANDWIRFPVNSAGEFDKLLSAAEIELARR